jgi:hypothetical protein
MAGMVESPDEVVPERNGQPANRCRIRSLPPHRTGRTPEGKHMTVAGLLQHGQRADRRQSDFHFRKVAGCILFADFSQF